MSGRFFENQPETFISFNLAAWVKITLLPLTFGNIRATTQHYAIYLSELVLRMQLSMSTIYDHVRLVLLSMQVV